MKIQGVIRGEIMHKVKMKRLFAVALTAIIAVTTAAVFTPAFAAGTAVTRQESSVVNAKQGDSDVTFTMILENTGNANIDKIEAKVSNTTGFSNGESVSAQPTLEAGKKANYTFKIDVNTNANYGTSYITVTFYSDGAVLCSGTAAINVARNILPPAAGFETPVIDVAYKLDGDAMKASETTNLGVTVSNRGNIMLQDVQVSLGLPDVMSLDNSAVVQFIGYMAVGESKTMKFPILTDAKAENKNYLVSVKISAVNKGATVNFDRSLYIPVTGGEQQGAAADLLISNISLPREAATGDEFTLAFDVTNNGKGSVSDVKIEATPEAGVVNKTKNVFVEPKLAKGETKRYTVTMFSNKEKTEQKSYPIKISATAGAGGAGVTQYASIFLNRANTEEKKTPRLIVQSYSYGGASVEAGHEFSLNIGLQNTSAKKLSNIKATLTSENGAIIPAGGSNSFYIESVEPNGGASKSLRMAASPTAEQRTTAMTLSMVYEDSNGNEFTSSDIISIPVVQQTALSVSDIITAPSLQAGVQANMSVQFYNVGKTQLRNLRIVAEGDFDTLESINYYVGNLDSGGSDSYEFAYTPRETDVMTGNITLVYYDPSGNERTIVKSFSFPVAPPPPPVEEDALAEPAASPFAGNMKLYIGAGAVLLILVIVAGILRASKNKKMRKEMEINE
jgi:hypothetical protein